MIQPSEQMLKSSNSYSNIESSSKQSTRNLRVSLKQWRMFHAVIHCGGFSDAAEFLHLSQSAISYTIGKLQDQVGLPLLKMEGRKAHITEVGREILARSSFLLQEATELEEFAERLREGQSMEVRLIVDHEFPTHLLMSALRKFSLDYSGVKLRIHELSPAQIEKVLRERKVDFAITGRVPSGFMRSILPGLDYVAVAHPDHPLFSLGRDVTPMDITRQVQIVISRSGQAELIDQKIHGPGCAHCWHVCNFDTALSALTGCLGYGWLPQHQIKKCLDNGTLKVLPMSEGSSYKTNFFLVHGRPWIANSATGRLAEVLQSALPSDIV